MHHSSSFFQQKNSIFKIVFYKIRFPIVEIFFFHKKISFTLINLYRRYNTTYRTLFNLLIILYRSNPFITFITFPEYFNNYFKKKFNPTKKAEIHFRLFNQIPAETYKCKFLFT